MFISAKYKAVKMSVADSDPPGCPDLASQIIFTIDFLMFVAFDSRFLIFLDLFYFSPFKIYTLFKLYYFISTIVKKSYDFTQKNIDILSII